MLMPYTELKTYFERFHVGEITRTELIGAIGLFQRMNRIDSYYFKTTIYTPRNISDRLIGIRDDYREELMRDLDKSGVKVLGFYKPRNVIEGIRP